MLIVEKQLQLFLRNTMPVKGLLERLAAGEHILIAEGYAWELMHRGYLSAGAYTPEVVVEHPEVVQSLSEEFVHAGTDVVEAFTYFGHRAKLQLVGKADIVPELNRTALKIAREVADKHGKLMAGNLSNTHIYRPDDPDAEERCNNMFKEQIEWAVEGKADYIIAETFSDFGEALLALKAILKYGKGLPAVVTIQPNNNEVTYDGVPIPEACRRLEEAGAAVVGLNCTMGPSTILPIMRKVRQACKGPIACLPVTYRTNDKYPAFQAFRDVITGTQSIPLDIDPWLCSVTDIADFAKEAVSIGIQYLGLCCGNRSFHIREVAEVLGRQPPASKYRIDMSKHVSQLDTEDYKYITSNYKTDFLSK